jgi:hypothetical protein
MWETHWKITLNHREKLPINSGKWAGNLKQFSDTHSVKKKLQVHQWDRSNKMLSLFFENDLHKEKPKNKRKY